MRSHHACHHAAVHHAAVHHTMHVNHAAAAHMAMHHFGGFGGTTHHVYHHSHHTNTNNRTNHSYYQPEPVINYAPTLDEVKSHLKKHLTIAHYQSAVDFENLVHLFLSSTEMSMKEKIQYLQDSIKDLDGPYYWDKYSDIIAQMPRYTADMNELLDLVIPYHFALNDPTYENAARDINHHNKNFVTAIEKHYLSGKIVITDFCKILNAHDEKKSMANILDYSGVFFTYLDQALLNKAFTGDSTVVSIVKNMESHNRQVFGRHDAAHSIMEKLLQKGIDANELFSLLKPSYGFDHDLLRYAHLLAAFANRGIDKTVIKAKLQTELAHRFKTLGDHFGSVFCQLGKEELLPHLDYDHGMRRAIYKEIKKLPAAEQGPILRSILDRDDKDLSQLFRRAPHAQFLFGNKVILPGYWEKKFESALAKLSVQEEKAEVHPAIEFNKS